MRDKQEAAEREVPTNLRDFLDDITRQGGVVNFTKLPLPKASNPLMSLRAEVDGAAITWVRLKTLDDLERYIARNIEKWQSRRYNVCGCSKNEALLPAVAAVAAVAAAATAVLWLLLLLLLLLLLMLLVVEVMALYMYTLEATAFSDPGARSLYAAINADPMRPDAAADALAS